MRSAIKNFGVTALAASSLAGVMLATPTTAQAGYHGYGYGDGWIGPAVVGGLIGALTASQYGYPACGCGYAVYGYPGYDYGYPAYDYGPAAYDYGYPTYSYGPPVYRYGYRGYGYRGYGYRGYGYRGHGYRSYGYRGYR